MNFEVRSELLRFDIRHSLFDILSYAVLALMFVVRALGKGILQYLSNLYCLTGRAGGSPNRLGGTPALPGPRGQQSGQHPGKAGGITYGH
jgi:hypothetical protein